jgi:hypothetical protein
MVAQKKALGMRDDEIDEEEIAEAAARKIAEMAKKKKMEGIEFNEWMGKKKVFLDGDDEDEEEPEDDEEEEDEEEEEEDEDDEKDELAAYRDGEFPLMLNQRSTSESRAPLYYEVRGKFKSLVSR